MMKITALALAMFAIGACNPAKTSDLAAPTTDGECPACNCENDSENTVDASVKPDAGNAEPAIQTDADKPAIQTDADKPAISTATPTETKIGPAVIVEVREPLK